MCSPPRVRVAVVDSGVAADAAAIVGWYRPPNPALPGGDADRHAPHPDLNGHGTRCASFIGRHGGVELLSVQVLNARNRGNGAAVIEGVRWALQAGADLVNLSLGTTNAAYRDALRVLDAMAAEQAAVLVAAIDPGEASLLAELTQVVTVGCPGDTGVDVRAPDPTLAERPFGPRARPSRSFAAAWVTGTLVLPRAHLGRRFDAASARAWLRSTTPQVLRDRAGASPAPRHPQEMNG